MATKRKAYVCARCGKTTDLGLAVARMRHGKVTVGGTSSTPAVYVPLCSPQCALAARPIGEYYREANLALVHLSRQEFGHQGWLLLHALADAYAPQRDAATMRTFLAAFVRTYPCALCKSHLAPMVAAHPPDLTSRDALMRWLCARHNQVNARLGKSHIAYTGMPPADSLSDEPPSAVIGPARTADGMFTATTGLDLTARRVGRQRLGQATWLFLHSAAVAYQYAQRVTAADRRHTLALYAALGSLYPYRTDGARITDALQRTGRATFANRVLADRRTYMQWLCELHNEVNSRLGKPVYSPALIRASLEAGHGCANHHRHQYTVA